MQTSARNCFAGRVVHIRRGVATDEVELQLAGGARITCVLTSDRALGLGVELGRTVYALVSASSVILMTDRMAAFSFSARNLLSGSIKELHAGVENTEVVIALAGGDALVALVSNASAKELELVEGKAVRGMFKASCVILGVAG
jgi:molybdate transport system regulatory protein